MAYQIRITEPERAPRIVDVGVAVEVGREADGIRLADPSASRHHFRLDLPEGGLAITDLGSTFGTMVNGVAITEPTWFAAGDRVQAGATIIELIGVIPDADVA